MPNMSKMQAHYGARFPDGQRGAYHPSELPQHLRDAIKTARMGDEHNHLNALLDELPTPTPLQALAAQLKALTYTDMRAFANMVNDRDGVDCTLTDLINAILLAANAVDMGA